MKTNANIREILIAAAIIGGISGCAASVDLYVDSTPSCSTEIPVFENDSSVSEDNVCIGYIGTIPELPPSSYKHAKSEPRTFSEDVTQSFSWFDFHDREYSLSCTINKDILNECGATEYIFLNEYHHITGFDGSRYVKDSYNLPLINEICDSILKATAELGLDKKETAEVFVSFVQTQFEYCSDYDTTNYVEYYRFSAETLGERQGDCEDTSILLASLLYSADYDVALLLFPNHMAVGISTDDIDIDDDNAVIIDGYYFIEAACDKLKNIGESNYTENELIRSIKL